ncbi:hypothetical protein VNO80_15542 [Phaseolus coccineus]|uniref:Uncharacterized protein n=1 Tax=Phaseolus coccineus TaxID=3886 RepID=A0AAN9MNX3_PHACN
MTLELEWYDLVCFGIVGVTLVGSLRVLWMHEGSSKSEDERLLVGGEENGTVIGGVRSTKLWSSCWPGMHPLWLLLIRFLSFLTLAILQTLDVREYDVTIFVYYTDCLFPSPDPTYLQTPTFRLLFHSSTSTNQYPLSHHVVHTKTPNHTFVYSINGYRYWLRCHVPFCALILILSVIASSMHIVKAKAQPLYHNHLWIPCTPLWLLLHRAFAFLCFARIHFDIIALDGPFSFYFHPQWTFTLVMIYFALGTIISAHGCWQYINKPPLQNEEVNLFLRRDLEESLPTNPIACKDKETKASISLYNQYVEEEFKQIVGFWGYLMQITYQTSAGAVILTDIVFWCVIVPFLSISHFKLNMLMGAMHSLNAVFLLLDTALNNLPFPWFRVTYFVLWSCGYIIFQWIIHACGFTWWPYPFLELDTPWAPIWYLCLAVVHIPCYGFYSLIVKAKNMILLRFFPPALFRI